jgi:hypothetical protein
MWSSLVAAAVQHLAAVAVLADSAPMFLVQQAVVALLPNQLCICPKALHLRLRLVRVVLVAHRRKVPTPSLEQS